MIQKLDQWFNLKKPKQDGIDFLIQWSEKTLDNKKRKPKIRNSKHFKKLLEQSDFQNNPDQLIQFSTNCIKNNKNYLMDFIKYCHFNSLDIFNNVYEQKRNLIMMCLFYSKNHSINQDGGQNWDFFKAIIDYYIGLKYEQNNPDQEGNTLWHYIIACNEPEKLIQLFINNAEVNSGLFQKNNQGQNILDQLGLETKPNNQKKKQFGNEEQEQFLDQSIQKIIEKQNHFNEIIQQNSSDDLNDLLNYDELIYRSTTSNEYNQAYAQTIDILSWKIKYIRNQYSKDEIKSAFETISSAKIQAENKLTEGIKAEKLLVNMMVDFDFQLLRQQYNQWHDYFDEQGSCLSFSALIKTTQDHNLFVLETTTTECKLKLKNEQELSHQTMALVEWLMKCYFSRLLTQSIIKNAIDLDHVKQLRQGISVPFNDDFCNKLNLKLLNGTYRLKKEKQFITKNNANQSITKKTIHNKSIL